jgi:hypothetical protein
MIEKCTRVKTSDHDVLCRVRGQEARRKLTKDLERELEQKSILQSQLAIYRKAYPRYPDKEEEETADHLNEGGIG